MQDIILEIFKSLNNRVVDEDIRATIYQDLIPHIRLSDPDLAESLKDDDEVYAEAYETMDDDLDLDDDYE